MADKKNDPTVKSGTSAEPAAGVHEAVPVEKGEDSAEQKVYRENPDKPNPSTVAQVEVLPDEQ